MKRVSRLQRKAYKRNRRFIRHRQWYDVYVVFNESGVEAYVDGSLLDKQFNKELSYTYRKAKFDVYPVTISYKVEIERANIRRPSAWSSIVRFSRMVHVPKTEGWLHNDALTVG